MQQNNNDKQQSTISGFNSGMNIQPRFMFGVKSDVTNNILFVDDNYVIYPCGHNIVIYKIDDKTQRYIPGIQGSEGITALALSANKKWLAVCEKATKAICSVYNIAQFIAAQKEKKIFVYDQNNKKKRILVSSEYDSSRFISASFSNLNEKQIATLTGEPNYQVILWAWDKQKCIAVADCNIIIGQEPRNVSVSNCDPNHLIVTGKDVFRFFKLENQQLKTTHTQIAKKEMDISGNYTCHTWLPDGKIAICTDIGQIMILESNGDYKSIQAGDQKKGPIPIYAVIPYCFGGIDYSKPANAGGLQKGELKRQGFIIASESGRFRVFFKSDTDVRTPYKRIDGDDLEPSKEIERENKMLFDDIQFHKALGISLSPREDMLVFTLDSNQIIKVDINLERTSSDAKYEYLVSSFHSKAIYGLDVCIKKQLFATCGGDRTVRVWSYNNVQQYKMETYKQFEEAALCLALHPSGLHVIICFTDCVRLMNILDNNLVEYHKIPKANCMQVKFANGGHLFALMDGMSVFVYKFYTLEQPHYFNFSGHSEKIHNISWLEDDSGFVSCGNDKLLYFWSLYNKEGQQNQQPHPKWEYQYQKVLFRSTSIYKNEAGDHTVYATCSDKSIRELEAPTDVHSMQGLSKNRYLGETMFSQIVVGLQRKMIVAGVAETDKPGSIQVFRYPSFEKVAEVQAHSKEVEQMRLTSDSKSLFTIGTDGSICCFTIEDKMLKSTKEREYSEEILIEKQRQDELAQEINKYKADIEQEKRNHQQQLERQVDGNNKKIAVLQKEIEEKKMQQDERNRYLTMQKEQVDQQGQEELERLRRIHNHDMDQQERNFQEKMHADLTKYEELSKLMEQQKKDFEQMISELCTWQDQQRKKMKQEHELEKDKKDKEFKEMQEKLKYMIDENRDKRKEIEDNAWEQINVIKEKNKDELNETIKAGMESKARLTEVQGNYKTAAAEKEKLERDIVARDNRLKVLIGLKKDLATQIESQQSELKERDETIKDKQKKINDLRKKTQELEKFKFVLDYKIKELQDAVGPREEEIQKLNVQTDRMNQEVKYFKRVNTNLSLIIGDLNMRQKGLQREVGSLTTEVEKQEHVMKKFKDDVFETLQNIPDYKKLKVGIVSLYKSYVLKENNKKVAQGDSNAAVDVNQKRKYYESMVEYYRTALASNQMDHKQQNNKYMKENVSLLQEINDLRKELHAIDMNIRLIANANVPNPQDEFFAASETQKKLKLQQDSIQKLEQSIEMLERENEMLAMRRPQRLPPIENQHDENDFNDDNLDQQQQPDGMDEEPDQQLDENNVENDSDGQGNQLDEQKDDGGGTP